MKQLSLSLVAILGLFAAGASAQTGSDSCATPDVLVGTGLFNFDNTTATTGTEGQAEALCNQLGAGTAILNDVWFTWTATFTGTAVLETCNITTVDTKMSVYLGNTCPGAASLACNDDNCAVGFQSNLSWPVTNGTSYVIQLGLYPGTFPTATPGAGQFSLGQLVVPANDDCSTPIVLAGPGSYLVNNTNATTGTQGQTESLCLAFGFTAVINDTWFTYTPTTNGTVTISTCGVAVLSPNEDSKIAVYAGAGCPTAGTAIACNDDNCPTSPLFGFESNLSFPAVCGTTYTIQIGMYGGSGTTAFYNGGVDITEAGGTACATPVTVYCKGDGTATACPCGNVGATGNGCGNSLNANGGNLAASGNASVSGDTWVLAGSGVPNGPGLYFQGTTQLNGGNGVVFGDGLRCVGGTVIRLGIVTASGNASTYPTGVTPPNNIVISVKGFCLAGDVRNYQLWYRDSAAFCNPQVFNLTNALNVTWQP